MTVRPARLPRDIGKCGAALWRSIAAQVAADGLELDPRERELLEAACRERDMLASIEDALAGEPRIVRGAQGQLVAHPLLGEARRSRQSIATLLKAISLEDPLASAGKGAGSGSRTTSWQARAAATTRHRGT
jgi:hypothetical protein